MRDLCLGMLLLGGCHPKDHEARETIERWHGKKVNIPTGIEARILGRDTTVSMADAMKKDYCVLTFFDSTGCTECNMQLHDWNPRVREMAGQGERVSFVFVVHARNFAAISAYAVKNKFDHVIFHDKDRALWRANPHLPTRGDLHTFLLDDEQKVVLIGNPARHEALWELYKSEIEKKEK